MFIGAIDSGVVPVARAIVPGSFSPALVPGTQPGAPGTLQILDFEVTLAMLQAIGAFSGAADFVMATLPANARVFPSTAEIDVLQGLAAPGLGTAQAMILSSLWPTQLQSFVMPSSAPDVTSTNNTPKGGASPAGDIANGLNMSQGGQTIKCRVSLSGANYSALTAGDLKARILYTILSG